MPSPSPFEAPRTRPAMSTKVRRVGMISLSWRSRRASQTRIRHGHVADIGLDRAERIIRRLRRRSLGQGVEQRRLADIGQPDDAAFETHEEACPVAVVSARLCGAADKNARAASAEKSPCRPLLVAPQENAYFMAQCKLSEDFSFVPTLFDPIQIGDLHLAEPHPHGAADPQPLERREPRAQCADARLLRPARLGRPDHHRGHLGDAAWASAMPIRPASGRRSRSTAGSSSPTPCTRPAAGSSCSSGTSAASPTRAFLDGAAAGRAERDRAQGQRQPAASRASLSSTPRALETDEIPASSTLSARARRTPRRPASTAWKCTAPTAICSTSSCRTAPTSAPTRTAARSRTAPG